MAASTNDRLSKSSNGGIPASTTVSATRATGVTTLSVNSQVFWPTDTGIKFQTYKIDTNNKFVPGSLTDWKGVSNGTNAITNIAVTGGAPDGGNAIGDIVVMSPTAQWGEDFTEAFLQEHTNPLGKHGNITTTAITNNGNYSQSSGTFAVPDNSIDANELSTSAIALGYAQITSNFTTTSGVAVQVTGLSATVTVPAGGRRIKITCSVPILASNSSATPVLSIWDGVVNVGTQIAQANGIPNNGPSTVVMASVVPSAGSKTYNIGILVSAAGTATVGATVTGPAFILVEAA